MKRLRQKLIEEFKEWSGKFNLRGMIFKYGNLQSVRLNWSMYSGRTISLRNDLSKTIKDYKGDYTDVPIPILRASIKYFKERNEKEKRKIPERVF